MTTEDQPEPGHEPERCGDHSSSMSGMAPIYCRLAPGHDGEHHAYGWSWPQGGPSHFTGDDQYEPGRPRPLGVAPPEPEPEVCTATATVPGRPDLPLACTLLADDGRHRHRAGPYTWRDNAQEGKPPIVHHDWKWHAAECTALLDSARQQADAGAPETARHTLAEAQVHAILAGALRDSQGGLSGLVISHQPGILLNSPDTIRVESAPCAHKGPFDRLVCHLPYGHDGDHRMGTEGWR